MVRQQSHLVQKLSPINPRYQKSSLARYVKQPPKSPLAAIHPSARTARVKLQNANTNRFLRNRTQLSTIHEQPQEEEEEAYDHSYDPYRGLNTLERNEERDLRKHASEEEDMDWDDETTLVAMLHDVTPGEDEDEKLIALANKLKAPMSAQNTAMKQYLAETIVPVITHVKELHGTLEDKVDLAFGAGVITFDKVCKKVETMALHDEDDLKVTYADVQGNMKRLVDELEQAYTRREDLWTTLQEDVDKCGDYHHPSPVFPEF
ncbi:uncharacterized protein FIBRA_04319 [Fibroporia radiculosa]|uniref:Uncharacterized protein n=1 Tax=Fibroporia radiculosa TaxID=599839 RepID=J4G767_9APHY|nr:uncharacterized protein FIBRA_04319 [Fibroporia radiculosa]CCM02238.1 predicted protein [Fibroporia radiculosa]